jgi:hypothetical protein
VAVCQLYWRSWLIYILTRLDILLAAHLRTAADRGTSADAERAWSGLGSSDGYSALAQVTSRERKIRNPFVHLMPGPPRNRLTLAPLEANL